MKIIKRHQQGGNPIGQYGNALDYYNKLQSDVMSSGMFDSFMNQPSKGGLPNQILDKINRSKQLAPGVAFGSLLGLNEMSKISALKNKPMFGNKSLKTASWTGQEGGMDSEVSEDQMMMEEQPQQTDINEIFNILKQYAEDKGFSNEDGTITKENMKELLLLLETDVDAEFEREKLMEILPSFVEEKNPEEALRNYWNRGVIPMNRREDVLKYGNPDIEYLQEGRNFKTPDSEEYRQRMGYKDRSPYKDLPEQTFDTDSITMEGVSQPLLGVANNGMIALMEPGNNYHFLGATSVTEYPLNSINNRRIGGLTFRNGGIMGYQENGEVVDNYDYRASELGPEAVITSTRLPKNPQVGPTSPNTPALQFSTLEFNLVPGTNKTKSQIVAAFENSNRNQDIQRLNNARLNAVQIPGVTSSVASYDEMIQSQNTVPPQNFMGQGAMLGQPGMQSFQDSGMVFSKYFKDSSPYFQDKGRGGPTKAAANLPANAYPFTPGPSLVNLQVTNQDAAEQAAQTQAFIDARAKEVISRKKPKDYTKEDIDLINRAKSIPNKNKYLDPYKIAVSERAKKRGEFSDTKTFAESTGAMGPKMSLQQLPVVGQYIPDALDVTRGIGEMASGLGAVPYEIEQGNYNQAALNIALPLSTGILGGMSNPSNLSFSAKMINPFGGITDPQKFAYGKVRKYAVKGGLNLALGSDEEPVQTSNMVESPRQDGGLNMLYSDMYDNPQSMADGGIPDRYKKMGFNKVGQKRQSNRPGKKWMVLAKKGDQYKVVHGGAAGMSDFTKHRNENRRGRFWDRMGGKNSSKAKDPFSPLYWHKRFGTWKDGGLIGKFQDRGAVRGDQYRDNTHLTRMLSYFDPYSTNSGNVAQYKESGLLDYFDAPQKMLMKSIFGRYAQPSELMTGNEIGSKLMGKENYGVLANLVLDPLNGIPMSKVKYGMKGEVQNWDILDKILFSIWGGSKINDLEMISDRIKEIAQGK